MGSLNFELHLGSLIHSLEVLWILIFCTSRIRDNANVAQPRGKEVPIEISHKNLIFEMRIRRQPRVKGAD
jgi:hypothetical protein